MDIIFKYDLARLRAFEKREENINKICVEETESEVILKFPSVRYFNYAFHRPGSIFTKEAIKKIKDCYLSSNIPYHKILVETNCAESNALLSSGHEYQLAKKLVRTRYKQREKLQHAVSGDISFIPVDSENILEFSKVYLESFDAEHPDYESAGENFKRLLEIQEASFYLLKYQEESIGVNALFHQEGEALLAGGAVLKAYRGKGYHKKSIAKRINMCIDTEFSESIFSSAYNDSISLKNMHKMNMHKDIEYNIYEYCN